MANFTHCLLPAPLLLSLLITGCSENAPESANSIMDSRPNILMILADDLGYSDIQPFGGEIPTPNLTQLAASGMRFTNFHTAMKCNPTRAMLLSGLDNNLAADGPRTNYQLRSDVPTIAETLRASGYHTYIAGKWDVGSDDGERPYARGFERSFVLLPGAGTHFPAPDGSDRRGDGTTRGYSLDGRDVTIDADFYSTTTYTQRMIEFIESNIDDRQPFFAYTAYTAPHYPLQAPYSEIAEFEGWYTQGYRAIHEERLQRLSELGLIDDANVAWDIPAVPEWESLSDEERAFEARRMQVYATMVANLDNAIGNLLSYLDSKGIADNTLVIFASDNGADGTARGAGYKDTHDNRISNLGSPSSYVTQGLNWAQVSSTPYRLVKGFPTEGGTRAPMIVRWPGVVPSNSVSSHWLRISDLASAFRELASTGISPDPSEYVAALTSGRPLYAATDTRIHTYIERRLGGVSVLKDNFKLVWWKQNGQYRVPLLFDLANDPAETNDVADDYPEVVDALIDEWQKYASSIGPSVSEADPGRKQHSK